jgi:hypothetical protein
MWGTYMSAYIYVCRHICAVKGTYMCQFGTYMSYLCSVLVGTSLIEGRWKVTENLVGKRTLDLQVNLQ